MTLAITTERIRDIFGSLIGAQLLRYETAELQFEDGSWESWDDLPIRLFLDSDRVASIAWSRFDDLWLSQSMDLPFDTHGSTTRWIANSKANLNDAIGGHLQSVMIGRGEMSIEGEEVEIWTRLLLEFGDKWLEVYNALDENGYDLHYDLHYDRPNGEFIECVL